jgi:hypothetical protein
MTVHHLKIVSHRPEIDQSLGRPQPVDRRMRRSRGRMGKGDSIRIPRFNPCHTSMRRRHQQEQHGMPPIGGRNRKVDPHHLHYHYPEPTHQDKVVVWATRSEVGRNWGEATLVL